MHRLPKVPFVLNSNLIYELAEDRKEDKHFAEEWGKENQYREPKKVQPPGLIIRLDGSQNESKPQKNTED